MINNKKYGCLIYLNAVESGYSGVVVIKQPDGADFTVPNLNLNNLKKLFSKKVSDLSSDENSKIIISGHITGNIINGKFMTTPIGTISNNRGWSLVQVVFDFSESKGKLKISGLAAGNRIELTKKNNKFSEELEKYGHDLLIFESPRFVSSDRRNEVNYNDKGTLSFQLKNNCEFDLSSLSVTIKPYDSKSGITDLENNNGIFNIKQGGFIQPEIDIYSTFDLPQDSVRFLLEIKNQKTPLLTKIISVKTNPFFLTSNVTLSDNVPLILKKLNGFYGFDKSPYKSIKLDLTLYSQAGGKFGNLWMAAFTSTGKGGFIENTDAAREMAQKDYKSVLDYARRGDGEAQYLMFYAIGLGLAGENPQRDVAGRFLKNAAETGFLPAMYDYAMYLMRDSLYSLSLQYLNKCYEGGMQHAASAISLFYKNGYDVPKDFRKALDWCEKIESFGDPDTYLLMARMWNTGDDNNSPDAKKTIYYATKAADLKNSNALNFMAKIYLNGRAGIAKNIPLALKMYKSSADLGNMEAMSSLAFIHYFGQNGVMKKDEKNGIMWAKKAAESGSGSCMTLLADLYAKGKIDGKKDIIRSSFWANQASLRGEGQEDRTAYEATANNYMNILGNIDLSDNYSYYRDVNTGDVYRVNEGPDLIGSLLGSFFTSYSKSRENQQEVINGLKLIYEKGNRKIYGGTITSRLNTEIMLFADQRVKILSYGSVSLGMMAGIAGPSGTYGFQSYSMDPSIPHGAIIAGMNNKWSYVGAAKTFVAPADGRLQVAINDLDYTNNKGYFDIVIEVTN